MPKLIDPKLKASVRKRYILTDGPSVNTKQLAKEFALPEATVRGWAKAEQWETKRLTEEPKIRLKLATMDPKEAGTKKRGRKKSPDKIPATRLPAPNLQPAVKPAPVVVQGGNLPKGIKYSDVLAHAIADLAGSAADAPVRSKEGAYKAMAELMMSRNGIALDNPQAIAEHCVAIGISPDKFLQHLQKAWAQKTG